MNEKAYLIFYQYTQETDYEIEFVAIYENKEDAEKELKRLGGFHFIKEIDFIKKDSK